MEPDQVINMNLLLSAEKKKKRKLTAQWTPVLCFSLCNEVKSRPELWNACNENYHDRNCIRLAWEDIAAAFSGQFTSDECAHKWQSLRASHRREMSKIKIKHLKSGSGAIEPPTWPFFIAMKFLPSSLSNETTITKSNLIYNLDEGSRSNSATSTSQSDLRARIEECRNEMALARDVHKDKDRILTNFVYSSLKTMEPEAAAGLRKKIKWLVLEEMVAETEPQNDDDVYSV